MVPHEPPKQRAARIPLDYYKERGNLERWKLWLALAALALTAGWLATGLLRQDGGRGWYSRGPVAAVHAAWEENCNACHVPFTPITAHASDTRCQECHQGPAHHSTQAFNPACASCHRDHQGHDASLVRLADGDCTQCHAELQKHRKRGANGLDYDHSIPRFSAADHPEFKPVREARDLGNVKFSHRRHMAPGMDMDLSLKKIPGVQPGQFPTNRGLVQLECASCHELDGSGKVDEKAKLDLPRALAFPARTAGAYMLPVVYEKHCQACHPLTFEGGQSIRHRLQPGEIHQLLETYFLGQVVRNDKKLLEKLVPTRPLPGKVLEDAKKSTLQKRVQVRVRIAEELLFRGQKACGECHTYENQARRAVNDPLGQLHEGQTPDLRIRAAGIPQVWFPHAVFNHSAHHAVDCLSCHPRATTSLSNRDVLVPGKDNCLMCHAPRTASGGATRGGARFDCTECHRYHGGDHPLQGIGARDRGPRERRDAERFLEGLPALKGERQGEAGPN